MGLKNDIYTVFYDNLSDTGKENVVLTDFQEDKLDQLATGLTDAIINWIQKQEFQITEMEATVDIEEIKTAGPYTGDLTPGVTFGAPPTPVISPPGGFGAVMMPSLFLSKYGGTGGFMTPKAKAYIGPEAPKKNVYGLPNVDKTKVKLLKVKDK